MRLVVCEVVRLVVAVVEVGVVVCEVVALDVTEVVWVVLASLP